MPDKPTLPRHFESLSWDDLVTWAGSKIAARGRDYQRKGRVKELAITADGGLIASVIGSERYAVQVRIDAEGILESQCTCPYELDCKHGVATVLEYLDRVVQDRPIPKADPRGELLAWTSGDDIDGDDGDYADACGPALSRDVLAQVDTLLSEMTKADLVKMVQGFVEKYPQVASELQDTVQLRTGDVAALTTRLRREIREAGSEPGWQDRWGGEGYTPDYSGIRDRLEALLAAGHADAVLDLGEEIIESGTSQVATSEDEGETAMEVSSCIAVLPRALSASSLPEAERLLWALDAVLDDQFDLCAALADYLREKHARAAWNIVADALLKRLTTEKFRKSEFGSRYWRDQLTDWTIHALEQAGRQREILPLCEAEAEKTDSYVRLVMRLIALERFADAERWIHKGVQATYKDRPGIASQLWDALLVVRIRLQDWPAVAVLRVEEFVRTPSVQAFENCREAAQRLDIWAIVRRTLLEYLAGGQQPWKQPEWPLPAPDKDTPQPERSDTFPEFSTLIEIAIHEKNPEEVLRWYDRRPRRPFFGYNVLDGDVATAVASYAPDRAVNIWKTLAEREIARTKPSAYHEAAGYLRKAAKVMLREKKEADWEQYLASLRAEHFRKKRLLEVLDTLSAQPIVKKRR